MTIFKNCRKNYSYIRGKGKNLGPFLLVHMYTCILGGSKEFSRKKEFLNLLLASQSDAHRIAPHRDPNPNPSIQSTYSSRAEKGQTEQNQNAGVKLTKQNWDIRNNLFRQNFCRSLRKFRNCIKNVAKPGIASKHN